MLNKLMFTVTGEGSVGQAITKKSETTIGQPVYLFNCSSNALLYDILNELLLYITWKMSKIHNLIQR